MSSLNNYVKICDRENRNRKGASSKIKRRRKKLVGQTDCFQNPDGDHVDKSNDPKRRTPKINKEHHTKRKTVTESVMFIPYSK